jgi:ATP-dependent DNA helicase RecQ
MAVIRVTEEQLLAKAREVFGIRELRPGQRELLAAVLGGRDAVGVLPTGGGKSLVYQLASLYLPRPVVVVTPLISLAEDQADKLAARGVSAARLDSSSCAAEARVANGAIAGGKLEVVYVTPERLQNCEFLRLLRRQGCSLLVIDEAHCVSQWGHDFRPAYSQLGTAALALGRPPILALTAAATPEVERDFSDVLGLENPFRIRTPGERKNLHFSVHPARGDAEKLAALSSLLGRESQSGLIYCSTIKAAKVVHEHLLAQNQEVGLYHGALHPAVREATQAAFRDGRYRIVVATKAFGMGIDKPNTRFVIHYQLPDSLESYVQESGRAGRDGEAARCTLIFDEKDAAVQRFFLKQKQPPKAAVAAMVAWLASGRDGKPGVAERWQKVIFADLATMEMVPGAKICEKDFAHLYEARRERDGHRLKRMLCYAQNTSCRTAQLLRYFGDEAGEACGRCDGCGQGEGGRRAGCAGETETAGGGAGVRGGPTAVAGVDGRASRGPAPLNGRRPYVTVEDPSF